MRVWKGLSEDGPTVPRAQSGKSDSISQILTISGCTSLTMGGSASRGRPWRMGRGKGRKRPRKSWPRNGGPPRTELVSLANESLHTKNTYEQVRAWAYPQWLCASSLAMSVPLCLARPTEPPHTHTCIGRSAPSAVLLSGARRAGPCARLSGRKQATSCLESVLHTPVALSATASRTSRR